MPAPSLAGAEKSTVVIDLNLRLSRSKHLIENDSISNLTDLKNVKREKTVLWE